MSSGQQTTLQPTIYIHLPQNRMFHMLLDINSTSILINCQQFICKDFEFISEKNALVFKFNSQQKASDVVCNYCGSSDLEVHDNNTTFLKDIPIWCGIGQTIAIRYQRFKCKCCNKVFSEDMVFTNIDGAVIA